VRGDVSEADASPYVLSEADRDSDVILMCSTFARSDLVVEPLEGGDAVLP
jgi:hypothetical protein